MLRCICETTAPTASFPFQSLNTHRKSPFIECGEPTAVAETSEVHDSDACQTKAEHCVRRWRSHLPVLQPILEHVAVCSALTITTHSLSHSHSPSSTTRKHTRLSLHARATGSNERNERGAHSVMHDRGQHSDVQQLLERRSLINSSLERHLAIVWSFLRADGVKSTLFHSSALVRQEV